MFNQALLEGATTFKGVKFAVLGWLSLSLAVGVGVGGWLPLIEVFSFFFFNIGTGHSSWFTYCTFPRYVNDRLAHLEGTRLCDIGEVDEAAG